MQQTKYCNNVTTTSASANKKKHKQIKTHETDVARHKAYYSY